MSKHKGTLRTSRRIFLQSAAISGVTLTVGLPASALLAAEAVPDVFNVAFFLASDACLIPKGKGWYEQMSGAKIKWIEAGTGAEINTEVAAGSVDLGLAIGFPPTAAGISQSLPYQVVAVTDLAGAAEDLVVRKSANIATPADLKGKKVATPFGSTSHFRLMGLLKVNGLTEKDVTVLDLRPDAAAAAWHRGDIDAAYIWNPALAQLVDADGVNLMTWKTLEKEGYTTGDLIVVRTEFAKQYPAVVIGFLRAFLKGLAAAQTDRTGSIALVAKQVGDTVEHVSRDMYEFQYLTAQEQLSGEWLGPPGQPGKLAGVLKNVANFLMEQKSIRSAPDLSVFEQAINTTFLERAAKA